MITIDRLRRRIEETEAWADLRDALALPISAEEIRQTTNPWLIQTAFGSASVTSEKLRLKLHRYPMPEWEKMGQYSDFSLLYHLESGLSNACQIAESIATHARAESSKSPLAILDFGAGLCRILRYLVQFVPEHCYYASEVNPLAINWGKQTFSPVNFLLTGTEPPLALPDSSLDVAYAWSIFSHYAEELHLKWLEELARVLKPGGLLILTTQGRTLLDRIPREEQIQEVMRLSDRKSWDIHDQRFDNYGYVFYESYTEKDASALGINPASFGMAFISPDYIRKNWMTDYELLQYAPGNIANFQDYVVLRRR